MLFIYMQKIILLGNINSGKSTFLNCLQGRNTPILPTIGVYSFKYGQTNICDTSGDVKYRNIVRSYYNTVDLFVLMYRTPVDLMHIDSIRPNGKSILVYNGKDETVLDEGYLYSVKYNMGFYSCNVVNTIDSKWTWNRIFEILDHKEVVKTDKGWRYCWFY